MKSGNKILFFTLLLLIGLVIFYFSNNRINQVQAIYNKEEIQELKIKEIAPTTFAFKTLDNNLVEIGIEKHSPPQPYLKLNKWDNEVYLKVGIPYITSENPILVGNKIRYSTIGNKQTINNSLWQRIFSKSSVQAKENQPKVNIEFYPREPQEITEEIAGTHTFTQNEQGGVEFDTILYEKPETNQIIFPIETQGLKFYYQPSLDPDHPTWADEDGDGVADTFRPENVVGSYAVYHATKGNIHSSKEEAEKYKAGKAFHIYRPKIIDSNGWEIWGELNIDEQSGSLSITISQDFLNSAVYPITIDPTFGYDTTPTTDWTFVGENYAMTGGDTYSPSSNGTGVSMSFYGRNSGDQIKMALYDSSNESLEAETEAVNLSGSPSWVTANFSGSPSVSSNINYRLSFKASAEIYVYYDTAAVNYKYASNNFTDDWPNPISWTEGSARKWGIYCTYEVLETIGVQATIKSWISFSVSATSTTLSPEMVDSTGGVHIASSSVISLTAGTNNTSGYSIDIKSLNAALCHQNGCGTAQISSASTTLLVGNDGYGAQATSSDPEVTISASYNHATSTNTVGGLETTNNDLADTTGPGFEDIIWLTLKAAATSTKIYGIYEDIVTLTCTAGS
ncbi:hypothetical protein AMJ50_02350 [Parcubacteria bacterium DG_74_3]|nr:MAG: hypothetical protein AMJ50_02350 [Parcubacteria bacterium DG_74_3]